VGALVGTQERVFLMFLLFVRFWGRGEMVVWKKRSKKRKLERERRGGRDEIMDEMNERE